MNIKEDLIKLGSKSRPGESRSKRWIVIHETDNPNPTAGALNHAQYLKRLAAENRVYLSWHYTIDDSNIVRHIPDNEIAWHAGDGRKAGGGNMNGIGLEICVNKNSNFREAVKNTAKLVAFLMQKHGIGTDGIQQHNYFNGKDCPKLIRNHKFWNAFIKMCQAEFFKLKPS